MKNKIQIKLPIAISLLINVFIIILAVFLFKKNHTAIIYIDNSTVFNEFKMTKDLIKEGDGIMKNQKQKLDSLYKVANDSKNDTSKNQIVKQIIEQKQTIENFQNNFTTNNTIKIWKRINTYLKDFSQKNKLDIVIGVNKNGSVFYGKPDLDKTSEIVAYINKRYEGFN